MKKKSLLMSIVAATLGLGLAGGATFALFTSEAKIDISVTAGKVDVTAVVSNVITYSGQWNETTNVYDSVLTETQGTFTNGGTATVGADGSVTLDKVSPMDKVEFDITITNNSNIAIKERTGFAVISDDGLFSGLSFKADDVALIAGYSNWETIAVGTSDVVKHISIELKELAGNEYQDKTASFQFKVEAIQGNAYTPTEVMVSNQTELAEAVLGADENTVIKVASSETVYDLPNNNAKINIVGENAATTKFNHNGTTGYNGANISMKNVTLVGGTADYKGFQHSGEETYTDCIFTGKAFLYGTKITFNNCTFVQDVYDYCFWTYGCPDCTFNNCTFNTIGKAAKVYNESTTGEFNIAFNGCEFNSSENTHNKPAIAVNTLGAKFNITVNNCSSTNFNCNDDAMASWYTTRMASASQEVKCLIGCEGDLSCYTVKVDGVNY